MRGFLNSVLATLFVLVLLIVAPLIAVFGIPEFVPVVASSSQADTEPERPNRVDVGVGESARCESHDLFAAFDERVPADTAAAFDTSRMPAPSRDAYASSSPYDGWDVDDRGRVVRTADTTNTSGTSRGGEQYGIGDSVSVDGPSPRREVVEVPEPLGIERVSWQSAVRRLNELGISDYSLTPGRDGGEFLFTCSYDPRDDARSRRRFEAEAPEPLLAVRHVLLQIDEWNARRR